MQSLSQLDKTLEPFFTSVECKFNSSTKKDRDEGSKVDRSVSYCKDFPGLSNYLKSERGLVVGESDLREKIGIDSGQGFLKVCLNLEEVKGDESTLEVKRSRLSYSEGAFNSLFKDSGVKKLIILALVEDINEDYDNLKTILELVKVDIDSVFALDLKAANILMGIGTHSSTHPCVWCDMKKCDFSKIETLFDGGNLRTLGSVRKNAESYQKAVSLHKGKNKLSSAAFLNCEHMPISDKDDLTLILYLIPQMELHESWYNKSTL